MEDNLLFANLVHLIPVLVSNTVVNAVEVHTGQEFRDRVLCSLEAVAREESTAVVAPLKQCMCGLAIGLDSSHPDLAVLILQRLRV